MKKVIASTSLAVLIGLLVALPLSAQMAGGVRQDKPLGQPAEEIQLLILIDRMNLTTDQMQTLHDALKGVTDEASGLKDLYSSFRQDLIGFHGDEAQLDALIEGYRSKLHDAMEKIREQMKTAFDSLKDSLTIEQGELLRAALMPRAQGMMGPRMMPGMMNNGRMGSSPWGEERGFWRQQPMGRFGNNPWADKGEGFRPMRPGFAGADQHPLLDRGKELLTRANAIVKILELKLQAVGS